MGKKRKNKLKNFNHNSKKIAQKPTINLEKVDNTTQIKKDISTHNKKTHNKAINVPQKVDIFGKITEKISLLALKPKMWLKSRTKMIDNALKPQLISQIKKVIKIVGDKIHNLKETKPNYKQNEKTNTSSLINEENNIRPQISYIQPLSQSSPKVQMNPRKVKYTNLITDTNCNSRSRNPLPKLMSLNVQPSARLESVLNDLLERLYEESMPTINNDIESRSTSQYSINSTPTTWLIPINPSDYANEKHARANKIINRQANNFNAFKQIISSKNFNFKDFTLIASQLFDETTIRLYQEKKEYYNIE